MKSTINQFLSHSKIVLYYSRKIINPDKVTNVVVFHMCNYINNFISVIIFEEAMPKSDSVIQIS